MSEEFVDKTINCVGVYDQKCETAFVWSAADQAFFKKKGFTPPKRCKPCRAKFREASKFQNK